MNLSISLEPISSIDVSLSDISYLQSYNPIYSLFSERGDISLNFIGLDNLFDMIDLETIQNKKTREIIKKPVFIKYSPLLDPLRYLLGKYDEYGDQILKLPNGSESGSEFTKLTQIHNSSYVDYFFCYLSSRLYHEFGFIHGIDYYGSYLGIQENFKMNIIDDIEHLQSHPIFFERANKTYTFDCSDNAYFFMNKGLGSRANKNKIKISNSLLNISIENRDDFDSVSEVPVDTEQDVEQIYERESRHSKTISTNTSNNSLVNYSSEEDEDEEDENEEDENEEDEEEEHEDEEEEDEEDEEEDDEEEDEEEEKCMISIKNFPCQLICLEKCDGTLDELFCKDAINMEIGASMLFQVIMTLIMYQNVFNFTHNDLHTNNIMYVHTDLTHLVYHYRNKTYKVPTYGKIFKVIDFGRSIYETPAFGNKESQMFCSDSFAKNGDGFSQYNFEPFYNPSKPVVLPNKSFDLCRLACSIYDFIIDDELFSKMDSFQQLIYTWCLDDCGKNVLYKKTGEERYPNFKLYKMIARSVHNHVPENQLDAPLFRGFLMNKKDNIHGKKGEKIYEIHLNL
jgi:hypothetical protein